MATSSDSRSKAPHLDAFLEAANYFVGLEESDGENHFTDSRGEEMFELCRSTQIQASQGIAWCACLVTACEVKADIDWTILGPGSEVGAITSYSVDQYNAIWIEGPYFGSVPTPNPGDLISFVGDPPETYSGYEHGGHIGIVTSADEYNVYTIEGNCGNACRATSHPIGSTSINGYVRARWEDVGDDVSDYPGYTGGSGGSGGSGGGGGYTPLYTSAKNDRHDMTLREVCYMSGYVLTNRPTEMSISIMNYTTLLRDLYDYLNVGANSGGSGGNSTKVDTSQLAGLHGEDNIKNAVDYMLNKKYNAAAACGVVGCLITYSTCQPTYSRRLATGDYLEGIGAWEKEQIGELKKRVGYGWNTNLTGQMDYLLSDLAANHKELLNEVKNVEMGSVSAIDLAKDFVLEYNKHYLLTSDTEDAQANAKELYDLLIFTSSNQYAGGKNLVDIDGNRLEPQFTTNIPSDLYQTGIWLEYLSYSHWYDGNYDSWAAGTPERVVADNWAYQGFPYDRSIALVGGYYCVAVKPRFGDVGDVIVVTLENDESFAAIIADHKGDDATSEWGHVHANGVSIIEWCAIVTYNGKVQTGSEGAGSTIVDLDENDLGTWYGQNVISITNYGSYL